MEHKNELEKFHYKLILMFHLFITYMGNFVYCCVNLYQNYGNTFYDKPIRFPYFSPRKVCSKCAQSVRLNKVTFG